MARAGARGRQRPGDAAGEEPSHAATGLPSRLSEADALHPVRNLRQAIIGSSGGPPQGWLPLEPPAEGGGGTDAGSGLGPADPGAGHGAGESRVRLARAPWGTRTNLMAVLCLAAAVAAAATGVALLGNGHPPARTVPSAIPAMTSADGIGALRMFSTSTGWAQRLSDGAILNTTQGVTHWTVVSPPADGRILAVAEVDARTARSLTVPRDARAQATIQTWATGDGGAVWNPEGTISVQGYDPSVGGSLDFTDAEHGWLSQFEAAPGLAGTVLYRTVDGGADWTEVAATGGGPGAGTGQAAAGVIPGGCDALTASFASDSTGWVTGTCNTGPPPLYLSRDGGVTWTAERLAPLPTTSDGETSFPPTFTSAQNGTLLTELAEPAGISTSLFATTDGGITWHLRATRAGAPLTVDFLDSDHGWLVTDGDGSGGAPALYATRDGGSDWTHLNAFPYVGLSLDFVTPQVGWAAADLDELDGGPRYLVETDDGGRIWTAVQPHVAGPSPPV